MWSTPFVTESPVAVDFFCQLDISLGSKRWQKIKALKDIADLVAPDGSAFRIAERGNVDAVYEYTAMRRLQQSAQQMKERRFPASGWSHDCDKLTMLHGEVDALQCRHIQLSGSVRHTQVNSLYRNT